MLVAWIATASAATVVVDPSGAGDATTVEAADALLADGDTLSFVAGTHSGCIRLNGRSITVEGAGSPATTWDGGGCSEMLAARSREAVTIRGITLQNAGGRSVAVFGGSLLIEDSTVTGSGSTTQDGGGLWVRQGTATLRNVVVSGNIGNQGGGLYIWDGGALTVESSVFRGNHAFDQGGGLYADGGIDGTITDTAFVENTSDFFSGGLGWHLGSLAITASRFEGNTAGQTGGGVYAHHATEVVSLSDVVFSGNSAVLRGGALTGAYGATFAVSQARFENNSAGDGADVAIVEGSIELVDVVSVGASATRGGHIWVAADASASALRSVVCNAAGNGAFAFSQGGLSVENAVWVGASGAALTADSGSLDLLQVGVSGVTEGALALQDAVTGTISNSAWADVAGAPAASGTGGISFSHNAWWQVDTTGVALSDDAVLDDPLWPDTDGCSFETLLPAPSSPLIDAGRDDRTDPDGTRSDIGPWGGPNSPMADDDGDGAWSVQDCDDTDATIGPDAEEVPGDGIDQDCDGEDATSGGTDTATTPDTADPGSDDGADWDPRDRPPEPATGENKQRSCGLETGSAAAFWFLAAGVAVGRRRTVTGG